MRHRMCSYLLLATLVFLLHPIHTDAMCTSSFVNSYDRPTVVTFCEPR